MKAAVLWGSAVSCRAPPSSSSLSRRPGPDWLVFHMCCYTGRRGETWLTDKHNFNLDAWCPHITSIIAMRQPLPVPVWKLTWKKGQVVYHLEGALPNFLYIVSSNMHVFTRSESSSVAFLSHTVVWRTNNNKRLSLESRCLSSTHAASEEEGIS